MHSPFGIILKVLRNVNSEVATGLIVMPHWPTQSWWPYLTDMLIAQPLSYLENQIFCTYYQNLKGSIHSVRQ